MSDRKKLARRLRSELQADRRAYPWGIVIAALIFALGLVSMSNDPPLHPSANEERTR